MRNIFDWVALVGAIIALYVVISEKLYDPKNWYEEVEDEQD